MTAAGKWFRTATTANDLGYLKDFDVTFDPAGANTSLLDFEQKVDREGNVEWKKYDRQVGDGDWFRLDGWARLEEAKLGATWAASYDQVSQYDKKLTYALDTAQNRTSVTDSTGEQTASYSVDASSNRYTAVNGVPLTYDQNGNLIFDGYRLYVYDYLDRLCEVWDWVEGTQQTSQSGPGGAYKSSLWSVQPLGLSRDQIAALNERLHKTSFGATVRKKDGLEAFNKSLASSSTQQSSGPDFVLRAIYGYDTSSRRILRSATTDTQGVRWLTYDGWQAAEEYEDAGGAPFAPRKVYFDGIGIDEHLGYATTPDGVNWTRYVSVQDALGSVVAIWNPDGVTKHEGYEYDSYGNRKVFDGSAQPLAGTQAGSYYGYTGRQHDEESGLLYYRLRYLDPFLGRFMTGDPIGSWGDGASWGNGYAYVGNAGQTYPDPFGLRMWHNGGTSDPWTPPWERGPRADGSGVRGASDGGRPLYDAAMQGPQDGGGKGSNQVCVQTSQGTFLVTVTVASGGSLSSAEMDRIAAGLKAAVEARAETPGFFESVGLGLRDFGTGLVDGAVGLGTGLVRGVARTASMIGGVASAAWNRDLARAGGELLSYGGDALDTTVAIAVGTAEGLAQTAEGLVSGDTRRTTKSVADIAAIVGGGAAFQRLSRWRRPGCAARGGNPLSGTNYSDKVLRQMQPNPRTGRPDFHGFPREVDNFAGDGVRSTIRGADGIGRTKIELPGSLNGRDGVFEWIIDPGGTVNHRLFRPNG